MLGNKWKKTAQLLNRQLQAEVKKRINAERERDEAEEAFRQVLASRCADLFGTSEDGAE